MAAHLNLQEQLRGVARILETVVGPHVQVGYPKEILRWSCVALAEIARVHTAHSAFLLWEVVATGELLAKLKPLLVDLDAEPGLVRQADAASHLDVPPGEPEALERLVTRQRSILSDVIKARGFRAGSEELDALIATHVRECARRQPILRLG